jgi:hypothetical protein
VIATGASVRAAALALAWTAAGSSAAEKVPPTLTQRFPLNPSRTTPDAAKTPRARTAARPTSPAARRRAATTPGSTAAVATHPASGAHGLALTWLLIPAAVLLTLGLALAHRCCGGVRPSTDGCGMDMRRDAYADEYAR